MIYLLSLLLASRAGAESLTLAWDPSPEPAVGYRLLYGTESGQYTHSIDVGGGTSYTVASLPGGTWYFVVVAYDANGVTSGPSNEVSTSSCSTPDPFTVLGGGTCCSGDWLPPGMVCRTAVTSTTSTPAPAPTSPAPSSPASCATPDPFTVLGGGTCCSGDWLPPGMVCRTAVTSTAAPPPAGCTTPDPFVGIPGLRGECRNGGWVPVIVG